MIDTQIEKEGLIIDENTLCVHDTSSLSFRIETVEDMLEGMVRKSLLPRMCLARYVR
jgi:hypothetical protein